MSSTSQLLEKLCKVNSFLKVQTLQNMILDELEGYVTDKGIDRIGNVIARIKPSSSVKRRIMFTCHIDTPMLIGMGENEDNQINTTAYGDISKEMVDGKIFVGESGNEHRAYYVDEIEGRVASSYWIDDSTKLVANYAGEGFTPKVDLKVENGSITSWNAADRSGIACLISLAKSITDVEATEVVLCFLTRHYFGGRTMEQMIERFMPDQCIMVDFETKADGNSVLLFEDEYIINKHIRQSLQSAAKKLGYKLMASYNTKESVMYNKACERTVKYGATEGACVCISARKEKDMTYTVNSQAVDEMADLLAYSIK